MNKKLFLCVVIILNYSQTMIANTSIYKIGLLIVATGKYITFVPPLIESAQKYFCQKHQITYFVFTDGDLHTGDKIIKIDQKRLGWPYDTMLRCSIYDAHKESLKEMDYLFAIDADMRFNSWVGDEILSDRVAVLHPGFYTGQRGSYEARPISKAYVAPKEGKYYFAGGIYGGKAIEFLKMTATMVNSIREDQSKGVIAIWHDESHLNRYFIDNHPTLILSPAYCYPENWKLSFEKKLLALDKNHNALRR
jgi:histo-blood group ABO system transferase